MTSAIAPRIEEVREAISDPLFLADLKEVECDFKHVDADAELNGFCAQ